MHVVDASAADPEGQIDAVRAVLAEIDADGVPELLVFNKADLVPEAIAELVADHEGSVAICAVDGRGRSTTSSPPSAIVCARSPRRSTCSIPYERGDVLAAVHREGEVLSSSHEDDGVRVRARLADASTGRLAEFVVATDA